MMYDFRSCFRKLTHHLIVVTLSFGAVMGVAISSIEANEVISVEIGKTLLLELSGEVKTIMLGNPNIVDVVIEEHGSIFLLGKRLGETNFMALNSKGKVIKSSEIVVGLVRDRHVEVYQGEAETPLSTLSCNPRCVSINLENIVLEGGASTTANTTTIVVTGNNSVSTNAPVTTTTGQGQ